MVPFTPTTMKVMGVTLSVTALVSRAAAIDSKLPVAKLA